MCPLESRPKPSVSIYLGIYINTKRQWQFAISRIRKDPCHKGVWCDHGHVAPSVASTNIKKYGRMRQNEVVSTALNNICGVSKCIGEELDKG